MFDKAHTHLKYVYFTQTTFVRVSIKFWQYYRQPLLIFLPQNSHRIRISFLEKSYSPFAKWRPLISINLISTSKEMNPIIRKIIKNKISYGPVSEKWLITGALTALHLSIIVGLFWAERHLVAAPRELLKRNTGNGKWKIPRVFLSFHKCSYSRSPKTYASSTVLRL